MLCVPHAFQLELASLQYLQIKCLSFTLLTEYQYSCGNATSALFSACIRFDVFGVTPGILLTIVFPPSKLLILRRSATISLSNIVPL